MKDPKKMVVLTRCTACPYSKKVSDPGSGDSFDANDEAMICTLADAVKYPDRWLEHRAIVRCSRWPSEFDVPIPDWCPLPNAPKRAK